MRSWPTKTLALGGDYNPEQWPRSVWDEDIELMQRANISFVSLGIFSWSWLEPAKGEYEFEWLDTIMDKLHAGGVAVDLATANATPPPWLSAAHPEILPVDVDGHPLPRAPRARDVARVQRVRLPQPALLLRRVRPPLPHLAAAPLPESRAAQRRLGHGLLEPALHRLGPDPAAAPVDDLQQPDPRARLQAVQLRRPARPHEGRAGRARRALPRRAGHHELHDADGLPAPRLLAVDPHRRRSQHRPLHRRRPGASPGRARLQR